MSLRRGSEKIDLRNDFAWMAECHLLTIHLLLVNIAAY